MQSSLPPVGLAKTREQAAYELVRAGIVGGHWAPGEPLVGSRIAEELGVSRITVANALKRLSGEGFIRFTPHKGAEVARLNPAEVREIYLIRAELEALAAREAARQVSSDDLRTLHAMNHEIGDLNDVGADIRQIRSVDRDFHHAVRGIARMPQLDQKLQNLADQCECYRARLLDPRSQVVPSLARHEGILAALEASDAGKASEEMRTHVLSGMGAVLTTLDEERSTGAFDP